ncbi:MAG: hypothetical protein V4620_06725 [Bacteroidota bacterium]
MKFYLGLLLSVFFVLANNVKSQTNHEEISEKLLDKNVKDTLIVIGKWNTSGGNETHMKYLGDVKTTDGKIYKIVNWVWYWGISHRSTTKVLVYNEKNQFVGNYQLNLPIELPTQLNDSALVFNNKNKKECDTKLITLVDLKKGLPNDFFVNCKDKEGSSYYLTVD